MKVVVNRCYGGFSLSHEAILRYLELAGKRVWVERREGPFSLVGPEYWLIPPGPERETQENWHAMTMDERAESNRRAKGQTFYHRDLERNDPLLVRVVEEMGKSADGEHAELAVVEIPDDVEWTIEEYDGREWVAEKHRTW